MILSLSTKGFDPLSYDDIVKPLKTYTDEYLKVADKLADLQDNSSFGDYAEALKGDNSPYATRLISFQDKLNSAADELSRYGLSKVSRPSLIGLKREYNNDIAPIMSAAKQKKSVMAKINNYDFSHPDKHIIVTGDTSLNNWMDDSSYIPDMISGKENIYTPVKTAVTTWANLYGNTTEITPNSHGQLTTTIHKGFPQDIAQGIAQWTNSGTSGNADIDNTINEITKNVLSQVGLDMDSVKGLPTAQQKEISALIVQGVRDALIDTTKSTSTIRRNPAEVYPTYSQLHPRTSVQKTGDHTSYSKETRVVDDDTYDTTVTNTDAAGNTTSTTTRTTRSTGKTVVTKRKTTIKGKTADNSSSGKQTRQQGGSNQVKSQGRQQRVNRGVKRDVSRLNF